MAKLDEVLCPNNRILSIANRIRQALSLRGVTSTISDDQGEAILSTDTATILARWDEVLLQLKRTHLHLFLISGFDGIEIDPGLVIKPKRHMAKSDGAIEDDDLADLLHVRDEKVADTVSGTFTSGSWQTRTLNTVITNEISGASLASDQITLPAGTYFVDARAQAFEVNRHHLRLRDTTGTATLVVGASSFCASSTDNVQNTTFVAGRFTLSVESVIELQHRCQTSRATIGFGVEADFDEVEVFAEVFIKKIS